MFIKCDPQFEGIVGDNNIYIAPHLHEFVELENSLQCIYNTPILVNTS